MSRVGCRVAACRMAAPVARSSTVRSSGSAVTRLDGRASAGTEDDGRQQQLRRPGRGPSARRAGCETGAAPAARSSRPGTAPSQRRSSARTSSPARHSPADGLSTGHAPAVAEGQHQVAALQGLRAAAGGWPCSSARVRSSADPACRSGSAPARGQGAAPGRRAPPRRPARCPAWAAARPAGWTSVPAGRWRCWRHSAGRCGLLAITRASRNTVRQPTTAASSSAWRRQPMREGRWPGCTGSAEGLAPGLQCSCSSRPLCGPVSDGSSAGRGAAPGSVAGKRSWRWVVSPGGRPRGRAGARPRGHQTRPCLLASTAASARLETFSLR